MTAQELKNLYLNFFKNKGHQIIPSASLIPENDPTVLFTTAGMHPLIPYLLGETHPLGRRLASCQKCLRTDDIEEVGDTFHLTFFEMLGNWSLGDYWKEESISWSYQFLTEDLKLEKEKLAVTCFSGDEDAVRDEESAQIWKKLGLKDSQIYFLPKKDNWWGPVGETGPCGPDTEIFYWVGPEPIKSFIDVSSKKYWVEIWNNVFMEYERKADGHYLPLRQKNVDTGMGLERTLMVLNHYPSVYETDVFSPIIKRIDSLAKSSEDIETAKRIMADHLRASTFILADEKGIMPSNVGQGYILRRLIRRAIRYGLMLKIEPPFCAQIAQTVIDTLGSQYPELIKNQDFILENLKSEEEKFNRTLSLGLKEFQKMKDKFQSQISGELAFLLYQSYGFPLEMIEEEARRLNLTVDREGFKSQFRKHQELSREHSASFKSGLINQTEPVTKLHTATHLLLAALRTVLGPHIIQKGSQITSERLRFDFSHPNKLTPEQIKAVEDLVNKKIEEALPVTVEIMDREKAFAEGAIGTFKERYPEKVKVYRIGDFSKEICAGPHVKNTNELGHFKIIKEEAVSSGVRRIKAILE